VDVGGKIMYMYIITAVLNEDDSPNEIIVNGNIALFNLANYFENHSTRFKVNSSIGSVNPEDFGWQSKDRWNCWVDNLYEF
jgi:hypothetical protein